MATLTPPGWLQSHRTLGYADISQWQSPAASPSSSPTNPSQSRSSAVLPTGFFGILLGNFEATHARAVSPRSRQRGLQRESYGESKGTPQQTDS